MVSVKVIVRTIRYLLLSKPYFAHLCITHQCNLRCHYCRIWQQKCDHLNLDQWKSILNKLDQMGIAVISITGGEPLLYPDLFKIIEYAKWMGFYVRLTSNGTLPRSRYDQLLETNIDAITISLDDFHGNDLPYSKVSPKILRAIKHLYNNAHEGQNRFSISMVLNEKNLFSMAESLDSLKTEFPGLMVFVQPVVTGSGKFRRQDTKSVNLPRWLMKYSNVLNPSYFYDFCDEINNGKRWKCQAGELFFDIKPNGQFFICQDFDTELNILEEDFIQDWQRFDFSATRSKCFGCTYSCYVLTQEGRKPKALLNSAFTLLKYFFFDGTQPIGNK